jgi:hypothetical protein
MRIPKWLRWLSVMLIFFAVLPGIVIAAARRGDGYCVLIAQGDLNTFIDPHTPNRISVINPRVFLKGLNNLPGGTSPDNNYTGYLVFENSSPEISSLYLHPLFKGRYAQAILIEDNIPMQEYSDSLMGIDWSPDSQQFVYIGQNTNKQWLITIASPDGNKESISFEPDNEVQGNGWSADSSYYAFSVRHGLEEKRALYYWSSTTRQFIDSKNFLAIFHHSDELINGYEITAWAPQGHNFAFLSPGIKDSAQLVIASPDGKFNYRFDLEHRLTEPGFDWSPDSKYLALSDHPELTTSRWYVDIFGADGTAFRDLSQSISMTPNSHEPQMAWSTNSDRLIYMELPLDKLDNPSTPDYPFIARLMAFDPATQHRRVLAENINIYNFYYPGAQYIVIEWWKNKKVPMGVIDLFSGKRYEIVPEYDGRFPIFLSPNERFVFTITNANNLNSLRLMTVDGSWQSPLTIDLELFPEWSPDSTMIFFVKTYVPATEVGIIGIDGKLIYQRPLADPFVTGHEWQPCNTIH